MYGVPSIEYIGDNDAGATLKIGQITQQFFRPGDQPRYSFDFSQYTVGDKLSIKFNGNKWRGAYDVTPGEEVE